ncbi:MAG: phosphoglycerate dehydrogenase [SAR202 cluster bacterium]|nr:phosphoglycerate dehydrogenase [SAR202 cluster bacterium]
MSTTAVASLRVLVSDPLHEAGAALLKQNADVSVDTKLRLPQPDLVRAIREYDALIVRSETQVTAEVLEAGQRLRVVGRAGVGVDNIDLDAATRRGIAVVNAPTGNTVAAAEHTVALLLAMARNIPQSDASLKKGEWRRSQFMGVEVRNKVLGVIGLGRVGSEVARRAIGLQMRVLAFDPFITAEVASRLGVELAPMERVVAESDFLTLHTPLTAGTKGILGAAELSTMKKGSRILNVARGGLVDEDALLNAVESGHLAGAALDVYTEEPPKPGPLFQNPKIITVPHLGASTVEAQASVAEEVVQQVMAVLRGQPARFTVNAPFVPTEDLQALGPYMQVATTLGRIAVQLVEGQLRSVSLTYDGELAQHNTAILKAASLIGLLQPVSDDRVNLVNAGVLAQQRGLRVEEHSEGPRGPQQNLLTLEVNASGGMVTLSGTVARGEVHIVRVRDLWMDMVPDSPYLLFVEHRDRPGMIGAVGTITGRHDVNISFMEVGRRETRGRATMVLGLDDAAPPPVLEELRAIPEISGVKLVRL